MPIGSSRFVSLSLSLSLFALLFVVCPLFLSLSRSPLSLSLSNIYIYICTSNWLIWFKPSRISSFLNYEMLNVPSYTYTESKDSAKAFEPACMSSLTYVSLLQRLGLSGLFAPTAVSALALSELAHLTSPTPCHQDLAAATAAFDLMRLPGTVRKEAVC